VRLSLREWWRSSDAAATRLDLLHVEGNIRIAFASAIDATPTTPPRQHTERHACHGPAAPIP
jgi:hypothetical protein